MEPTRLEGGYWEKILKEIEEARSRGTTISLKDLKCSECGRIFARENVTVADWVFFSKHGVHCESCMNRKFRPWVRDKK
jgi:hypothetical protein